MKLAEEVSDGGKRDVLIPGIINRGDHFNAKVQRVNEFLSEKKLGKIRNIWIMETLVYKHWFGTIQQVKNYREILKT